MKKRVGSAVQGIIFRVGRVSRTTNFFFWPYGRRKCCFMKFCSQEEKIFRHPGHPPHGCNLCFQSRIRPSPSVAFHLFWGHSPWIVCPLVSTFELRTPNIRTKTYREQGEWWRCISLPSDTASYRMQMLWWNRGRAKVCWATSLHLSCRGRLCRKTLYDWRNKYFKYIFHSVDHYWSHQIK